MTIDLSIRFTREVDNTVLCFRHAVKAAVEKNQSIELEIDEFGASGNDMRETQCSECSLTGDYGVDN